MRYIRKIKDTNWYISDIFQKDQESFHFTKDALLYQDILKYSLIIRISKGINSTIGWCGITRNLLMITKICLPEESDIVTRIHAKKEIIDRIFNNLTVHRLIEKSGTEPSEKPKET